LKGFRKILKYKFHENPFIGSRAVSCGTKEGWTDGRIDGRTHRKYTERRQTWHSQKSFFANLRTRL